MKPLVLGTLSFVLIFAAWEAAARLQLVNPFFVSSPTAIATTLAGDARSGELQHSVGVTLAEFGEGFTAAVVVGLVVGVLAGSFRTVDDVVSPFVWFLYSSPLIAFYPIVVLWFGLGLRTVIAIAFLLSVAPVVVNTSTGIANVSPTLEMAARAFGASRRDVLWKVTLPAAVPMIVAGLRLAVGRALTGVVVAELFVPSGGLGSSISYNGALMKTNEMFASLMVVVAVGVVCTQGLRAVESRLGRWRTGPGL